MPARMRPKLSSGCKRLPATLYEKAVDLNKSSRLVYQDLVRTGQLATEGRLPPVLPIVLYNGSRRWDAPVDVAALVIPIPGGLETYCPRLKYFLLDEGRYADSESAPLRNL